MKSNDPLVGGSGLWHRWTDKKGSSYRLARLNNGILTCGDERIPLNSLEDAIHVIPTKKLFVLCTDILSPSEIPYNNELLGEKGVTPYLSRVGGIPALRINRSRSNGFFVPTSSWGFSSEPSESLVERLTEVFETVGYQSTTYSSLSERILRSTLPEKLIISRPHPILLSDILNNHEGGRIDKAEPAWYEELFEYDENKSYLARTGLVPSPFISPERRYRPELQEALESYPCGYWQCRLIAHETDMPPILLNGRRPKEGENIEKWLWSGTVLDCIEAGYTLCDIRQGYGFRAMSDFLARWSELLWEYYSRSTDKYIQSVFKQMMVGLPGRFLRKPEKYTLIRLKDCQKGDIPLKMNWLHGSDPILSDYAIRPEYDIDSCSLAPIGSYIVNETRRVLYHRMKEEQTHGNQVIRSYIDCFAVTGKTVRGDILGELPGDWKEQRYRDVWVSGNRLIGTIVREEEDRETLKVKAPGFSAERRRELTREYERLREVG